MDSTTAEPATTGSARPAREPLPAPIAYFLKFLKALASLQLTVVLFALAILLVFFGTLAQVDFGIWTVVDQYFWSWGVRVPTDLINKFGQVFFGFAKGGAPWEGWFPLPGGKLIGLAMVLNLVAAHIVRFKLAWRRSGVILIHSGILLLFFGEFVTREMAVEQRMSIDEGSSTNFTEDTRHSELAFADRTDPTSEHVTVIPEALLRNAHGRIAHPDLPVDVEVVDYMVNSDVDDARPGKKNPATAGQGLKIVAVKRPEVSGVDPNQKIDTPAAYVRLFKKGTDEQLGTYLVGLRLYLMGRGDTVEVGGKPFDLSYRFKRYYKPYSLALEKFRFDRYPGTQKPKNYSSEVVLRDPELGTESKQTIRMNEPLRHRGETFYQSSFDEKTEQTTYLQVVNNPGWTIPYISCVVVTLGLLLHFGLKLTRFLNRRPAA